MTELELGPVTAAVEETLARARRIPWLRPRAELADAERAEPYMRDTVARFRRALRPFAEPESWSAEEGRVRGAGDAGDADRVPIVGRSMRATCDLFERVWRDDGNPWGPYAGFEGDEAMIALLDAQEETEQRLASLLDTASVRRLEAAVHDAIRASIEASPEWVQTFGSAWKGPLPGTSTVLAHARWLVGWSGAVALPSPFEPVLAIMERGGWPTPMPEASLHVYLAATVGGRVEPEPSAPGSSVPAEWRSYERVRDYDEIDSWVDRLGLFLETVGTWPWPAPPVFPDLAEIGFPGLPWIFEAEWVAYPP